MRFRKVVLLMVMICCALVISSCGKAPKDEEVSFPTGTVISPQGSETGDGLTPTNTPTPTEAEKGYRFMVVRDYDYKEVYGEYEYVYSGCDEYEYDSAGRTIRHDIHNADSYLKKWYVYEYDAEGKKKKETVYTNENEWDQYEYDSAGRQIKHTEHRDDEEEHVFLSTYEQLDETGRFFKETNYNYRGQVLEWYERTYDSNGNLLASKGYLGEAFNGVNGYVGNELIETIEKEYDEFGMCVKDYFKYNEDEPTGETKVYERDENGHVTRIFSDPYPRKSGVTVLCRSIEDYSYDSRGKVIERKEYIFCEPEAYMGSVDGPEIDYTYNGTTYKVKVNNWAKYEYDDLGRKIKYENLRYDGTVKYRYDYEYTNDLVLLPNQKPTVEFEKGNEFDFPVEDQIYFEELEKTHIEPFLNGYIIKRRTVVASGIANNGYMEYYVTYDCDRPNSTHLRLTLWPQTRMSWDVTRIEDNMLYDLIEEWNVEYSEIGYWRTALGLKGHSYWDRRN